MTDIITTKSIGKGIVEIEEDFILCEEPLSRLVFSAQIHNRGIRGRIIRQRRETKNDTWISDKSIDIRKLGKNESINLEVNTKAVENLYFAIIKLEKILKTRGIELGENKYAVVDPDSVIITDHNKSLFIKKLIDAGYDEEFWEYLTEVNPALTTKLSHSRIQKNKQNILAELAQRLEQGGYKETTGDDSWQNWIHQNNWLFGINYKKPIEKTKINITGVMPDYLFPTIDDFVDILEIKLPEDEVLLSDSSHKGAWKWSSETNTAIGQVINYLGEIDRLRFEIEKNIKSHYGVDVCLLKPRAYILIGNSKLWPIAKKEGLRKMNHALHGIEILTYQDLINRGQQSINITPCPQSTNPTLKNSP